jgi:hypothetical protein
MRVIRPSAHDSVGRRRALLLASSMLATGLLAGLLAVVSPHAAASGLLGGTSAVGLGIGGAWLVRARRPNRARDAGGALAELLGPVFDDDYVLIVGPRLPVRDAARLDALLVGPAGVRVITVRDWDGRYRVRARSWEFDARRRRGWISCRTNPSFDAVALAQGVARWTADLGMGEIPLRAAVAFPSPRSRIVLEEPADEIVTTDNAPWWANAIGRVRRLDPVAGARFVEAVLDAGEPRAAADGSGRLTRVA